ncbi:hypothetical protein CHS0354_016356 [Potamilus streckersoni]|uniref:Uncharacterized protein n=1 Tax=Potamilus streckersoni TaxID=2493646 RepID=A0AAE0VXW8_9BIVA|nr:hypothetical protein CHS0354_016356 [Potamilus streckersoni]
MQGSKIRCTAMVFCLWVCNLRKVNGFSCSTSNQPLWESDRCTFYFNWNCSLNEGEEVILKTWIKEGKGPIANCTRKSNFTITNGFEGRLERYNENGFILKGLTTKDTGYYRLVVIFNNTDSSLQEEGTGYIYVPSKY